MIKSIALVKKKPGLSDEEFYRYWKEKHAPLALRVVPGLRKYVQNHTIRLPGTGDEVDGMAEVWFDDLEALQRYLDWRQTDEARVLLEDEKKFIDMSKWVRYVAEEHIIK